jgi:hypothetical protein
MRLIQSVVGGLLLAGVAWTPTQAQGLPQGSYLRSCGNVAVRGDTLTAVCRRTDGGEQPTSLGAVHRCVGDIGNNNGNLHCSYGGGAPPPRADQRFGQEPGYAGGQGRPGYGQEWEGRREHCEQLRGRLHEIRDRMHYARPWEQDRLGTRLHATRERLRHECWGHWREDE